MSRPAHPLEHVIAPHSEPGPQPRGLASARDLGRRADHVWFQVAQQAAARISRLAEVGRRRPPSPLQRPPAEVGGRRVLPGAAIMASKTSSPPFEVTPVIVAGSSPRSSSRTWPSVNSRDSPGTTEE